MKVAIVGSRDFDWPERGLNVKYSPLSEHTEGMQLMIRDLVSCMDSEDYVVSGGAQGADSHGEKWAKALNVGRIIHAAHWRKHGKGAGPIRNRLIVADADILFAFHTNREKSIGTANCVKQARKKGIPVYEFDAMTSLWYIDGESAYVVIEAMYAQILEQRRRAIESNAQRDEGAGEYHGDMYYDPAP